MDVELSRADAQVAQNKYNALKKNQKNSRCSAAPQRPKKNNNKDICIGTINQ
jgi:hypothetical protein